VLPRVLAAAATAWSVVYLVAYLWLIDAQDGAIAWWYVVLMVFAAVSRGGELDFRLVCPSTMSQASGSDRASRSSLVTIKVSPTQQAASASRNPVRWRLVLVRPWSP
jgi:hypothetical protein